MRFSSHFLKSTDLSRVSPGIGKKTNLLKVRWHQIQNITYAVLPACISFLEDPILVGTQFTARCDTTFACITKPRLCGIFWSWTHDRVTLSINTIATYTQDKWKISTRREKCKRSHLSIMTSEGNIHTYRFGGTIQEQYSRNFKKVCNFFETTMVSAKITS